MISVWFDLILVLLILSLVANIATTLLFLKKRKAKVEYTIDAKALLKDLATGPALVKIEYVDRSEIFLRSPRNM